MRSLSSALATALGAPVQQPAILVEAGFATTRRWSSFATVTWAGFSWSREDILVEGLRVDPLRVEGSILIGNHDDLAGNLVLADGVTDRVFRIWGYDAAATALSDVVWLCDAVGASAEISPEAVRINLRHACEYVVGPRTYLTPGNGFGSMLPPGAVVRINGIDYRLERRN